jgi:hypothetical protein
LSQQTLVRKSGVSWSHALFAKRPSYEYGDCRNVTSTGTFVVIAALPPACVAERRGVSKPRVVGAAVAAAVLTTKPS